MEGSRYINNWFAIEKIDLDTYAISEYKHWEETHSYLLIGSKKALLIDTGMGISNIKKTVEKITPLPIEVVSTHIHWDHIGGHHLFENIAVHVLEEKWLLSEFPIPLEVVKNNLKKGNCDFPKKFDVDNYRLYKVKANKLLNDGDIFDLGSRIVKVIHTPGHSPGHMCFYEPDRKYLFSGDLIYKGTLYAFYPTTDPIKFMNSIKKIRDLNIKRIFPGHYSLSIRVDLINEIDTELTQLYKAGKLKQGNGIYDFKNFKIHI